MRKLIMLSLSVAMLLIAGCATGPTFNSVENGLTQVPAGEARIYLYRTSALGAAIQPEIKLNGNVVGKAVPHGVFFVDQAPGNVEVVTGSEVEKTLTFTIAAGETRYVRFDVGLGLLVYRIIPELVGEDEAKKEISDLAYTGNTSPRK